MKVATKTNDKIVISKDLEGLITSLTKEEFLQLKESILSEGCRDPLIVWENRGKTVLVDGHHRYKICKKHNIPFDIRPLPFKSKNEVKDWMINNQLGRRNLNPLQLSYFRGVKYLSTKQSIGGHIRVLSKGISNETTAEQLAKEFKASPSTIRRDAQFAMGLSRIALSNPELKSDILTGSIKVKKSDVILLSIADKDFSVSDEMDIKDLANYLRKSQLDDIEKDLSEIDRKKRIENAREILKGKEPMFLNREDQISTIKGKIISAINQAIKNKDIAIIDKIKELIDKLEMAISFE